MVLSRRVPRETWKTTFIDSKKLFRELPEVNFGPQIAVFEKWSKLALNEQFLSPKMKILDLNLYFSWFFELLYKPESLDILYGCDKCIIQHMGIVTLKF